MSLSDASFVTKGTTSTGVTFYHALIPGMQNGGPDGVALAVSGKAIQFLSYEVGQCMLKYWHPC
jgi:hypothetical protein